MIFLYLLPMKVKLIAYTPEPDKLASVAANTCYSSRPASRIMEKISPEKSEEIIKRVVASGHHSVIEHAVFTFSIEGVSRALTHQLVRHRIASYSQQSQRYVSMKKASYVVPKSISKNPEALERYESLMADIWDAYSALADMGIPKEDARYLLPNACMTNIVVTMNARELLNFFKIRTCMRAQWEIRDMANRMMAEVKKVAPVIFEKAGPTCRTEPCPEPDYDCPIRDKMDKLREKEKREEGRRRTERKKREDMGIDG